MNESQIIVNGWDSYAEQWQADKFSILPGHHVQYLGDEWTVEAVGDTETTYGLEPDIVTNFDPYIEENLLNAYLQPFTKEGLEIGPGGGRLTALLIPRTEVLHLVEPSETMLQHVKQRFAGVQSLRYYHTDGMTLPKLKPESLDYVLAFDVFVHFVPN
jgi:SAM-dependent methyltransferase